MTQFLFLNSEDIPRKEGVSDSFDIDNLDFAVVGRKVAKAYFEHGKCFRVAISKNEERGINLAGYTGDYFLHSESIEPTYGKDRVILPWSTLGLIQGDNLYEAILPPWFFEEIRDSQIGWSTAIDMAEKEVQTRRKLLDALKILNCTTPHLESPQMIAQAARDWGTSGFWMCFNHKDCSEGMYILDNRNKGTVEAPHLHKVYPFTAILAGTFHNKKASAPSDQNYVLDCLNTLKAHRANTPAEEYIAGDTYNHLQALKRKTPDAFLSTAFLAHGHLEQAMAAMPSVDKQGDYQRFKTLNALSIEQMSVEIGAAATNDCSDNESEQDYPS